MSNPDNLKCYCKSKRGNTLIMLLPFKGAKHKIPFCTGCGLSATFRTNEYKGEE